MNNNVSFDAMLQMAAREAVYRQLDSFPSPKELNDMFKPSAEHENKINRIIKKGTRNDKIAAFNRHFSKVAVVLLAAFTVTFTPLLTAQAVRESIVQTVIEWKDEFASIFFKSENEPAVINDVKIGYMVEGFESDGPNYKNKYLYNEFYYSNNKHITITIYSKNDTASHIDNEFSNYYIIIVDGINGIYIYNDNISSLIISNNDYTYRIEGSTDVGELVNIYKNIEIF